LTIFEREEEGSLDDVGEWMKGKRIGREERMDVVQLRKMRAYLDERLAVESELDGTAFAAAGVYSYSRHLEECSLLKLPRELCGKSHQTRSSQVTSN